jgi:heme o synthase
MNLVSQAAPHAEIAAPSESGPHGPIHAPTPGATATLIHDLRELFKVKVVALVLVTGWGGFYLGSMQSGISSVQRGLLDDAARHRPGLSRSRRAQRGLERKTDARMKRTADRPWPPAASRWPRASLPASALWPSAR